MGFALMADDRDMIIGELREGFRQMMERFRRQDEGTLVRDQQREADKREAIAARERDKREVTEQQERFHAENKLELHEIKEKATRTFGMAQEAQDWTRGPGVQLIAKVDTLTIRVTAIEDAEKIDAAESRGKKIAYGVMGAILAAIGLSALTVLVPDAIIALKRLLHLAP